MSTRFMILKTPVVALTGGVVALAAWHAGDRPSDYKFFDELIDVKHLITSRYVDQVDEKKLKEGAIKGMVEALEDPYTVYVPASEQREFNKGLTGEYVGIGAQVNTSSGWLTIVSPLEDSPAYRAGLMPDDKVLRIDGVSTQGMDVEKCVEMLSGTAGSPVVLSIDRKGRTLEVTIIRDRIKTRSVKGVHRDEKNPQAWDFTIDPARSIAYVRLTQFTPRVSEELSAALDSVGARQGKLKGLILDLRSNPGGLLSEAEAIADMFLREGIIVSTRGRAYNEDVRRAVAPGTLPDFPVMLMQNTESASASEVLAGALVDNNRAIVLGTRSFGKGSVQSLVTLESGNGSELKLTEQGYFLPSGRSITRKDDNPDWGVDPSPGFYVPVTDQQLREMFSVRRRLELLQNGEAARVDGDHAGRTEDATNEMMWDKEVNWDDVDRVLDELKDPQLTAAVRAMQARVDTGEWKTTGEALPQRGQIAAGELVRTRQWRDRILRELMRAEKRIDALETAAADARKDNPRDFWNDELDLAGGTLEVRDKEGKVVATLSITGNNLERWLLDADVEKTGESAER